MVTTEQKQSISGVRTYLPIEDYGIIGDLHTVALVGKNGSIDWYCTPAFDAPSVFAFPRSRFKKSLPSTLWSR
jgi:GH15 family glucan-1,4-alpha-glucosidase